MAQRPKLMTPNGGNSHKFPKGPPLRCDFLVGAFKGEFFMWVSFAPAHPPKEILWGTIHMCQLLCFL